MSHEMLNEVVGRVVKTAEMSGHMLQMRAQIEDAMVSLRSAQALYNDVCGVDANDNEFNLTHNMLREELQSFDRWVTGLKEEMLDAER